MRLQGHLRAQLFGRSQGTCQSRCSPVATGNPLAGGDGGAAAAAATAGGAAAAAAANVADGHTVLVMNHSPLCITCGVAGYRQAA